MGTQPSFVDYYSVLQVNPDCEARILEIAYHYFAKMYHPDNIETADEERFLEVVEAYTLLRDPKKRQEYNTLYVQHVGSEKTFRPDAPKFGLDERTALNDAEVQNQILQSLYRRRREHPTSAGIVGWLLQEKLGVSEENFEFHIWYLKSKNFIDINEEGKLAITVAGVDEIISQSRMKDAEKLLLSRARPGTEPADG
ncbi:J domain-containing protein [Aurantiacibacter hainanensis]|uniref:J domain-containing protein n=1 Tax=Aurantiacibacter hainanensis TaxID=3076114 RepID=UPI0030C6BB58